MDLSDPLSLTGICGREKDMKKINIFNYYYKHHYLVKEIINDNNKKKKKI